MTSGSIAYTSASETLSYRNYYEVAQSELKMPLVARARVGMERTTDKITLGAALNGMSPLGQGSINETYTQSGWYTMSHSTQVGGQGFNVVAEAYGSFTVNDSTVSASVFKSIRTYTDSNGLASILASVEDPSEVAYLGVGLGLTTTF